MRVTFVMATADLSGGNRVISIYAEHLAQSGHQVNLAWPANRMPTLRDRMRALVRRRPFPRAAKWGPSHLDRLRQLPNIRCITADPYRPISAADLPEADVVIATWWETAEWVAAFPAAKGAKVYFIQGWEAFDQQPADRVEATWRLPFRKIVVAKYLVETAAKFGDSSATLVPNAVDHQQFHAPPRNKQITPMVGSIYSTAPFRGFDITRKAFELARQQLPTLRLTSFSTHRPTPEMPLPTDALFTPNPPQDQIRNLYAQCDAWIVGSRQEGFGLPILEAMACRTPVIATPTGAAPELLASGGGVLVPMENPAAMAEAIVSIVSLPEPQWQAMSAAAHATAASYSWQDAAARFEAALHQAAGMA